MDAIRRFDQTKAADKDSRCHKTETDEVKLAREGVESSEALVQPVTALRSTGRIVLLVAAYSSGLPCGSAVPWMGADAKVLLDQDESEAFDFHRTEQGYMTELD